MENNSPSEQKIENKTKKKKLSYWKIATVVLGILFVVSIFTHGFSFTGLAVGNVANKALDFINKYVAPDGGVILKSVDKESGLYKLTLLYKDQEIPAYVTTDGKYLILPQGMIDIKMVETLAKSRQQQLEKTQKNDAFEGLTEKSKTCINKLNLNETKIETCVKNGLSIIQKEYELGQKYGAKGSPTIFLNGKKSDPINIYGDRTSNSFKKMLCCAFNKQPKGCKGKNLNCSKVEVPKSDKPNLTVFVMAECPYGVGVLKSLSEIYDEFKDSVNFDVHYVIYGTKEEPTSMHGPAELNQDITQLCIEKEYDKDTFWNYIRCFYGMEAGTTKEGVC